MSGARTVGLDGGPQQDSAPPERIDHYEVLRRAGSGGMSEVYIARDVNLGRKVALKLINSDLLTTPAALEQFTREARALASFNHPNIVTVYGVGRTGPQPYIAMEFIAGETLRKRYESTSPSQREAARIGLQIASALSEAHAHGIIHGDLKPENLIVGEDGRVRVVDFGLANLVGSATPWPAHAKKPAHLLETKGFEDLGKPEPVQETRPTPPPSSADISSNQSILGTPAYLAPEQWSLQPRTTSIDMWAFGVVMFELLVGERPYAADERDLALLAVNVSSDNPTPAIDGRREVDDMLARLVNDCLAKAHADRPSAADAVTLLSTFLHGVAPSSDRESPFRGLAAFGEEHASLFFGRDEEINEFTERARRESVLPIVGASGVGKSSFVQAGVVPRLREIAECSVIRVRPGSEPFHALAVRLAGNRSDDTVALLHPSAMSVDSPPSLVTEELPGEPGAIARALYAQPKLLALYLSRQAQREKRRVVLIVDQLEEVCTLVADRPTRLRYLAAVCGAADDASENVRVIFTARDDFLTRLAESPEARVALHRVTVLRAPGEAALLSTISKPLAAVGYSVDDPSLVSEMVSAVADSASALPLLQFAGTMLWERADHRNKRLTRESYAKIGGVQGALATHANTFMRDLSPRQVSIVRSVMLRLVTPEGTRRLADRAALIDVLGEGADLVLQRLVDSRLLAVRDASLELAHESLVQTWDRLVDWLEEGREELLFLAEVEQAATLWDRRGRRPSEVWTGRALEEASRNLARFRVRLPATAEAFIVASRRADKRRRFILRSSAVLAAAALVIIAVVSVVTSFSFAEKTAVARRERAAAQAEGARSSFLRGDFLSARAQLRASFEQNDSALARSVMSQLQAQPVEWTRVLPSSAYDLALSPDGAMFAVPALDHTVYLLDRHTAAVTPLRAHGEQVFAAAFSSDGRTLASADLTGTLILWSLHEGTHRSLRLGEKPVWKLAFSPDGRSLLSASWDARVSLVDVASASVVRTWTFDGAVNHAIFSLDGRDIIVGTHTGAIVRTATDGTGERVELKGGHSAPVFSLAAFADQLVSGDEAGTVALWKDSSLVHRWRAHDAAVTGLTVDAGTIVSVSYDGAIKAWRNAELVGSWRHHQGGVVGVRSLGAGVIASVGFGDKSVIVSNLVDATRAVAPHGHGSPVQAVAFTAKRVFSGGDDAVVLMWDADTGEQLAKIEGASDAVQAIDASDSLLVVGSHDKKIRVYALPEIVLKHTLVGHQNAVYGVALSRVDPTRLYSVSFDGTFREWSLQTGRNLRTMRLPGPGNSIALGRSNAVVTTTTNGHVVVALDTLSILSAREGEGVGVALSPDESHYTFVSNAGEAFHYRMNDATPVSRTKVAMTSARFGDAHPSLDRVGFGFVDAARIWDVAHPKQPLGLIGHLGEVAALRFDRSGSRVLTGGDDATVRVWDSTSGAPLWRARAALHGGNRVDILTHRGWSNGDSYPFLHSVRWAESDEHLGCAIAEDQSLAMWDLHEAVLRPTALRNVTRVAPSATGCVALLSDGALHRVQLSGDSELLSERATVFSVDGERVLSDGTLGLDAGATAIGSGPDWLASGYGNGAVELADRNGKRRLLQFQEPLTRAVTRIVSGPPGTIIASDASGRLGVWSLRDGALLKSAKVHGPAAALFEHDSVVYLVSTLGDVTRIDVSDLRADYCTMRERILRAISVTWHEGRVVRAQDPPPPCNDSP